MYSEKVLDHFQHPRNVGEIADATAVVEVSNPACGDLMKLWALVRDGTVVDIKFKTQGCVPSVACASWLTEAVKGRPLHQLSHLTAGHLEEELGGLPEASRHAAVLAANALQRLIEKVK